MTLEIPTELEAKIELRARELGMDTSAFVAETMKRATAIRPLQGSISEGSPTVDDFLRERSEEGRKEARL